MASGLVSAARSWAVFFFYVGRQALTNIGSKLGHDVSQRFNGCFFIHFYFPHRITRLIGLYGWWAC